MKPTRIIAFGYVVALVVGVIVSPVWAEEGADKPRELVAVEVREYEGEKLSSIEEFRENSIRGPQQIDREGCSLSITGLVSSPIALDYEQVLENDSYSKIVTLNCVEGWGVDILWEGILLEDLIDSAHALSGARQVIFHAHDGYTTSLPLEYIRDNDILLAYKMNGVTLPPERGFPFQLVAEEKWGYKWIKWVTKIELSDDAGYRGYWEDRGYSDDADVGENFFNYLN